MDIVPKGLVDVHDLKLVTLIRQVVWVVFWVSHHFKLSLKVKHFLRMNFGTIHRVFKLEVEFQRALG